MANFEINNTFKSGWVQIKTNDYYPDVTDETEHIFPYSGVLGICMMENNGNIVIELHIAHEDFVMFLTHDHTESGYVVDSINGIAVTSDADLKTKLLALFP